MDPLPLNPFNEKNTLSIKGKGVKNMWYFVWIVGVTMAVTLSIMHALWFEIQEDQVKIKALTNKEKS